MAKMMQYVGKFSAVTVPIVQGQEVLFKRGGEEKAMPDAIAEKKLKDEPDDWVEVRATQTSKPKK